jgi:hypothetical protein
VGVPTFHVLIQTYRLADSKQALGALVERYVTGYAPCDELNQALTLYSTVSTRQVKTALSEAELLSKQSELNQCMVNLKAFVPALALSDTQTEQLNAALSECRASD